MAIKTDAEVKDYIEIALLVIRAKYDEVPKRIENKIRTITDLPTLYAVIRAVVLCPSLEVFVFRLTGQKIAIKKATKKKTPVKKSGYMYLIDFGDSFYVCSLCQCEIDRESVHEGRVRSCPNCGGKWQRVGGINDIHIRARGDRAKMMKSR